MPRGLEHQSKGVENCLAVLNIALATGNVGREGAGPTMITGQGNGQGGREHGQKCDQLPGQRSLADPAAREYVARVWGISPEELPQPGYSAQEIMNAIHSGEIKGTAFDLLQSRSSRCPTRISHAKRCRSLEYFGVIDFFLSETAHHADVVLAGSLHEEEDGRRTAAPKGVSSIAEEQSTLRAMHARIRTSLLIWPIAWAVASTFRSKIQQTFLRSFGWHRAAAWLTTTASPTNASIKRWVSSGLARRSTIREHRTCSQIGSSSTRMARLISCHGMASERRSGG